MKAFARQNFGKAKQQALDAAAQAEAELAKLQKSEQAVTYELQGEWSNARQAYQALMRHFPGDAGLQEKLDTLSDKP